MMKLKLFTLMLLFICSVSTFAKDPLAILPFTGGQGEEGETIAELFSFNDRINEVFSPIPRTRITQAIDREQGFQKDSGMTKPDTMVSIARQLGARYVVAGNITSIGNNKLLVIAIMDIRNLQQIAGDYQTYNNLTEIRSKLPNMAANIIEATQRNTSGLPKLAIVPVQLQGGADQRVADTLTQILAIHLIKSNKYAVYPRTKSLEQVMNEHITQLSGITADSNIIGMGFGDNPNLVLSVIARKLENINMFNASIINLLTGTQLVGRSVEYRNINDGMKIMETMAIALSSTTEEIAQRQQSEEEQKERDKIAAQRKERWTEYLSYATRFYLDWFAGGYIQWGDDWFGGGFPTLGAHFSPLPFTSIGFELRFGPFFYIDPPNGGEASTYIAPAFTLGLVFPFTETVRIFADGILEIGNFSGLNGIFSQWVTPGFDAGIFFIFIEDVFGFDIKYRGTWYDGLYTHSVGLGFIWSLESYF